MNSQFDGITPVLRADFGQSARFNVWDQRRFGEVLRAMRLDPQTKPNAKQWREMAFRENVPLLVFSTVSKLGDGYRFSIRCEVDRQLTPDTPVERSGRYRDCIGTRRSSSKPSTMP